MVHIFRVKTGNLPRFRTVDAPLDKTARANATFHADSRRITDEQARFLIRQTYEFFVRSFVCQSVSAISFGYGGL